VAKLTSALTGLRCFPRFLNWPTTNEGADLFKVKNHAIVDRRPLRGGSLFCYIKSASSQECAGIREEFEKSFKIGNAPEGMLLARARHRERGYWYLLWLFAEKDNRALRRNFRLVEREYLPKEAELLVGHVRTFEKFFTYEKPLAPATAPRSNFDRRPR
jgi:hypothetical protein